MTRNIWVGIVVVVVLVAGGWWYFNQSSAPTNQNIDSSTPTNTNAANQASTWQAYRSQGFEVQYPKEWKMVREKEAFSLSNDTEFFVNFGIDPEESLGEWGIFVYNKSATNIEQIIGGLLWNVSDRKEARENITIGDVPAIKITVTGVRHSDDASDPRPPVQVSDQAVLVEQGNRYYYIHQYRAHSDFDKFYKSFRLI